MYTQRSALRWKGILSILCLTATLSASAQRTYTLDECLRLGAENNLTLRNSQLDAEAAKETAREAFTRYFPTVQAGGMILRADRYLVQMDLDLSALGVPTNLPPLGFLDRGKTAYIMAMQPLFAGGRIVNGNRLARLGQEATRLQASQATNKVRADVEHYFWEVVSLKEQLQTLDTLAAQLDELHRTVKASVDAGVTLPNALMKVELQQQNTASNRLKTANGLRINKLLLAQQTGIEEADFDVSFDAFPTFEAPETQFVEPTSGLSQRTDSRLLDIQVQHAQINRRMTLGNYLPTVALGGAYIYHDFMGKDARAAIVMATVSVPLSGWWGGSHALRRDKLKVQHAQNAREDARQLMRVDIETKWSNLSEAYLQIDLARRSVASATENLRLNRDSYEAGTVPLTDLLDAQTQLRLARDRYTEACTAYCNARTAYRQAVGEQGARIVPELSQFLCRRI